ncbi:hypothetical protein DFH06DRAFT_1132410 [Mycena polygramma]|nr:hypothetical protein DFH06DRAFT_1132410 [Mycena polygramma]
MADKQKVSELRLQACISAKTEMQDLWDFDATDATGLKANKHISTMKHFWQHELGLEIPEEWTVHRCRLTIPDEEEFWGKPARLDSALPLSLISTILCPISPQLQPVPSADFMCRSVPDYSGPQFPVRTPPTRSDSDSIEAMVNLLLCKDPTTAVQPDVRFPNHGDADCLSIPLEFALVPEWTTTTEPMIRRFRKAPVSLLSPAIAIGIQLESSMGRSATFGGSPRCTIPTPLREFITSEGPAAADCVFVFALRDETVFIVAHIPYLQQSTYRYQSLVVDQLPFPPYVSGDQEGVLVRLRIIVALLTIRAHTSRVASLWDDVVWPPEVFDAESALLRECTGIVTPSPSEQEPEEDEKDVRWGDIPDYVALASGDEERDLTASEAEIAQSKKLVDDWLLAIREVDHFEPAVREP